MGPSQTEEQQVWWVVEIHGVMDGADQVRVSDLIPEGSMLREMRIRIKPDGAGLAYDAYVIVGLISTLTPSDAQIVAMPRLIWFWNRTDPEGKWSSFGPEAEEEWLLAQKIEGSQLRLCVGVGVKGTDTADVRVGIRYRAGRS